MAEPGDRARLAVEPLDVLGGRLAGEDHLERDQAIEAGLARLVDDAHPAARDLAEDVVRAEPPGLAEPGERASLAGVARGGLERLAAARRRVELVLDDDAVEPLGDRE